jgi:hypothetical protein
MKRFAVAGLVLMLAASLMTLVALQSGTASAELPAPASPQVLSLITKTPEEGFALSIALARKGVTETQRDTEVLHKLRPGYAHNADSLIAASHVVAVHFQTVAAANDYWRR